MNNPPGDETEKARWRGLAVAWLRADLAFWTKLIADKPEVKPRVARILLRWKSEASLAGIRDEAAIKRLPEDEQKACTAALGRRGEHYEKVHTMKVFAVIASR